jgi:purine-nucleoside phosphorylase
MADAARDAGVALKRGVYAGLLGPTYETPAEVRMLATLGASAVGMSTVNEVIAARHRGLPCVGVSLITNLAAGQGATPLNHDEVQAAAREAGERFERLIVEFVRRCA